MASLVFSAPVWAQVALIQWSDAHSTLDSLTQQVSAIDLTGQNFLKAHPKGEFVIHVLGDFTSLNPDSEEDLGWRSFKALKILKERGYTVLYTPGNHDAFDWTVKVKGERLFLEQMETLKSWGIPVLAANFIQPSERLSKVLSPSYELKSLDPNVQIVGLTLEALLNKSNLNEETASSLFAGIQSYRDFVDQKLSSYQKQNGSQVILAAHQGHTKVASMVRHAQERIQAEDWSLRVPLALAAHDHQVAAYREGSTLISDGGSHGSFNIIEISKEGNVVGRVRHIALSEEKASHVDSHKIFREGEIFLNPIEEEDLKAFPELYDFHQDLQVYLTQRNQMLNRVLFHTRGLRFDRDDMKKARNELGTLLAESLKSWAQSYLPETQETIFGMANSSSYQKEDFIAAGAVRVRDIKEMYSHLDQARLYRLTGAEIEKLFFSLRKFYEGGRQLYTPQLTQNLREREGRLESVDSSQNWSPLKPEQTYLVALDGWLSQHRHGQGYRVPEWIEILQVHKTLIKKPYQEILIEHLPAVFKKHEEEFTNTRPPYVHGSSCQALL